MTLIILMVLMWCITLTHMFWMRSMCKEIDFMNVKMKMFNDSLESFDEASFNNSLYKLNRRIDEHEVRLERIYKRVVDIEVRESDCLPIAETQRIARLKIEADLATLKGRIDGKDGMIVVHVNETDDVKKGIKEYRDKKKIIENKATDEEK